MVKTRLKEGMLAKWQQGCTSSFQQEINDTHSDAFKADDSNEKLWNRQTKA